MQKILWSGILLCFIIPVFLYSQVSSMKNVSAEIRNQRQKDEHRILQEFVDFLSIPNVSADRENVRKNAEFIKTMMEKRGIKARVMETGGNPVVYGEVIVPDAEWTLGFYAHYDGQPVDSSKWTDSEPFEPVFRPGKMEAGTDFPKPIKAVPLPDNYMDDWRIYARGSSDDKAAVMALLAAFDALKNSGIPQKNNLKFIFEGEEEAGSTNLHFFLEKNKEILESDVLLVCDGPIYYSGDPTLFFGVRGITTIQITVYGPNTSVHSGHYGNWAPNPAIRLARLLATMKDKNGRVLVKGFYDTVVPLTEREKEALRAIPPYDTQIMDLYGFSKPEREDLSLMESIQLPSLNINGIQSGWVGDQVRTIVPSQAVASIDIRMVKDNDASDLTRKITDHIKEQGYHVVGEEPDQETRMTYPFIAKVSIPENGYKASRTSMDLPISKCIIDTLEDFCGEDVVCIPSLGGSLPISFFNEILGAPTIGVPIANHDNNQHQPDENLRLGHLWQGIETFAALMLTSNKKNEDAI